MTLLETTTKNCNLKQELRAKPSIKTPHFKNNTRSSEYHVDTSVACLQGNNHGPLFLEV